MNSTVTAGPPVRARLALIVAGPSHCSVLFSSQHLRKPVTTTLAIPVPTVAATRPTATTGPIARSIVTMLFVAGRASFMSAVMSNANMSSGAMVMAEATAVTTVILRTAIAANTVMLRTELSILIPGLTATVTAVSGAAGHCRIPKIPTVRIFRI